MCDTVKGSVIRAVGVCIEHLAEKVQADWAASVVWLRAVVKPSFLVGEQVVFIMRDRTLCDCCIPHLIPS